MFFSNKHCGVFITNSEGEMQCLKVFGLNVKTEANYLAEKSRLGVPTLFLLEATSQIRGKPSLTSLVLK